MKFPWQRHIQYLLPKPLKESQPILEELRRSKIHHHDNSISNNHNHNNLLKSTTTNKVATTIISATATATLRGISLGGPLLVPPHFVVVSVVFHRLSYLWSCGLRYFHKPQNSCKHSRTMIFSTTTTMKTLPLPMIGGTIKNSNSKYCCCFATTMTMTSLARKELLQQWYRIVTHEHTSVKEPSASCTIQSVTTLVRGFTNMTAKEARAYTLLKLHQNKTLWMLLFPYRQGLQKDCNSSDDNLATS